MWAIWREVHLVLACMLLVRVGMKEILHWVSVTTHEESDFEIARMKLVCTVP